MHSGAFYCNKVKMYSRTSAYSQLVASKLIAVYIAHVQ